MTSKPTYEKLAERVKDLELEVAKMGETDRRLERSEAFLNSIFHQSPHAMWISDDKGPLIEINRACCDLLNIAREEVVEKYNVLKDDIVEAQGSLPLVKSVFDQGKTATFADDRSGDARDERKGPGSPDNENSSEREDPVHVGVHGQRHCPPRDSGKGRAVYSEAFFP
jgi:PAS domain-containing protein